MKDEEFLRRYRTTVNDFIERRHVERVPEEELNTRDKPAWYRPYYPVKHLLKPGKVRVVHDCAAKFGQTALVVADIEAMFDQFLVDRKDCDIFLNLNIFLWWPNGNLKKGNGRVSNGETSIWCYIFTKRCYLLS